MKYDFETVYRNVKSIAEFRAMPLSRLVGTGYSSTFNAYQKKGVKTIKGVTVKSIAKEIGCSFDRLAVKPDFKSMNKQELIEWINV